MKKGNIIVISAPSGTGKTTICNELKKKLKEINSEFSISTTTRKPREKEIEGKDYFFVSKKEFKKMIMEKQFVEWANIYGYFYGTSKKFIFSALNKGKNIILNIDVQGASQIKKQFSNAKLIFILPPSWQELKNRLYNRKQNSEKEIRKRLNVAKKELKYIVNYDYFVVNDNLKDTVKKIIYIIKNKEGKSIGY